MSKSYRTLAGCQVDADAYQTALAASVAHLFKSALSPVGNTTKTNLEDNEADYDTYATKTMTAWAEPILSPGQGYMIGSPAVQWDVGVSDPVVGNLIGGVWIEDATGNVRRIIIFDEAAPMQASGQGIPFQTFILFLTGF